MDLSKLDKILIDEPSYRQTQIRQAVWQKLVSDWSEVTELPQALREKLAANCPLEIEAEESASRDGQTIKALLTLNDGQRVETVLMSHADDRQTVCVSSQVGCPLGCLFCATGKLGFKRNLTAEEILTQVLYFARKLKKSGQHISNVVFMGMGEPFLNYTQVIKAVRTLNDSRAFNLGARHISISTAGVIPGIKKLATEKIQVNLALSLHATNNKLRSEIMPINRRYALEKVMSAIGDYIKRTNRQVMFEYLLIKGKNDQVEDAEALVKMMKSHLYVVNLILYNDTGVFEPTAKSNMKDFKDILEKAGVKVTERYRFGQNIAAACGQLAAKSQNHKLQ